MKGFASSQHVRLQNIPLKNILYTSCLLTLLKDGTTSYFFAIDFRSSFKLFVECAVKTKRTEFSFLFLKLQGTTKEETNNPNWRIFGANINQCQSYDLIYDDEKLRCFLLCLSFDGRQK